MPIRSISRTTALSSLLASWLLSANAFAADMKPSELLNLSLKQLSDIEVTSVSKRSEKASEAAAAIYVITNEDIHRSGATSIPEALRLAPGLNVAQAGSHQWAISSRGFNDQFANKLLVLIDGRTVYTPLFSGVYWDIQDTLLDDIDRIEVIRGPGATLWGANAVNGVINIITKRAQDTQGGLANASAGNYERGAASVRYGGKMGESTFYRVYGKYFDRDESYTMADRGSNDSWHKGQGGFRADWSRTSKDQFTLQGDIYHGKEDVAQNVPRLTTPFTQSINDNQNIGGGNILGRWTHQISADNNIQLQTYIDRVSRNNVYYDETTDMVDVDFQHDFKVGNRNEIVWGTGYRLVKNNVDGTFYLNYNPDTRKDNLFNFFVQDKIAIVASKLFLTLGTKLEHNDYTSFEYQPSARLSWLINDKQTLWTSVSRAVRTPNRTMDDTSFASQMASTPFGPALVRLRGNRDAESEKLIAYEAGYRIQATERLGFDLATFINDYDNLVTNRTGTPFIETGFGLPPRLAVPVSPVNEGKGRAWGGELAATWNVSNDWQLTGSYSLLKLNLRGGDASLVTTEGKSPQQQFNLRSHWKITDRLEMDNVAYYVDEIQPTSSINVKDYLRFDTRIGWQATDAIELSLIGQNLLDKRHQEFSPFIYNNPAEIGRSVYANVKVKF